MQDMRKYIAEFIGTAILVIVAVGTATEVFGFKLLAGFSPGGGVAAIGGSVAAGVITTAAAFGLTLAGLAYALGPVSGCHVNPAVTLGFVGAGRMKVVEGIKYMIAQFLGAIGGALILLAIFKQIPGYSTSKQGMGTDGWGKYSITGLSGSGAFITEVVLTFIFVSVVLFATHKAAIAGAGGVAIGFSLFAVHLVGIPLTGTSVNPARSLGPALIVGGHALDQVWLFIVAPLVGAVIAAAVHVLVADPKTNVQVDAPEPAAA
jgi:aquaporin Z